MTTQKQLRIFTGSAHPELAIEIANLLNVPLGQTQTTHLPDSEIHVKIKEVVRGQDIFLIQPCSVPVNDNFMELLLYLDAFRRASAHSVSVVMPYMNSCQVSLTPMRMLIRSGCRLMPSTRQRA